MIVYVSKRSRAFKYWVWRQHLENKTIQLVASGDIPTPITLMKRNLSIYGKNVLKKNETKMVPSSSSYAL